MSGTASEALELLADCYPQGIRLLPAGNGGLTIDAPREALTPDFLDRLRAHKAELLVVLRPTRDADPAPPVAKREAPAKPAKPVCRCGSTQTVDMPIHGARSTRRDCAKCGRFVSFSVWYGKPTKDA